MFRTSGPTIRFPAVLEILLWCGVAVGTWEGVDLLVAQQGDAPWGGVLLVTTAFGVLVVTVQGGLTYAAMGWASLLPGLRWMRGPIFRAGAAALSSMVLLPLLLYYNRLHPGFGLNLFYLGPYLGLTGGVAAAGLLAGLVCERVARRPDWVRGLRWGARCLGAIILLSSALHWGAIADREENPVSPVADGEEARPNAVLITIDTLRPDHLQSYGYHRPTDPNIQRHFRDGLRFEEAYAPVPLTRASHASMLTGLHPAELGMRWNWDPLPDAAPFLPEMLRERGYHTAAFVAAAPLFGEPSRLERGFDMYSDVFNPVLAIDEVLASTTVLRLLLRLRLVDVNQRRADAVTRDVLAWLEAGPPEPFFFWVHYYDPHGRYEPPEADALAMGLRPGQPLTDRGITSKAESGGHSFTAEEKDLARTLYDGEILFADRHVGRVLDALEQDGRLDDAAVILIGDHGETLWEQEADGYVLDHGRLAEPWELRIPFFVRGPGVPAGVEPTKTARTQDVAPTMLALLGIPPPPGLSGRNLLDSSGSDGPRTALCFNAPSADRFTLRRCAKHDDYWFTLAPLSGEERLYALSEAFDPKIRRDRSEEDPELVERLRREVLGLPGVARNDESLDPVTAERLRALGYIE